MNSRAAHAAVRGMRAARAVPAGRADLHGLPSAPI